VKIPHDKTVDYDYDPDGRTVRICHILYPRYRAAIRPALIPYFPTRAGLPVFWHNPLLHREERIRFHAVQVKSEEAKRKREKTGYFLEVISSFIMTAPPKSGERSKKKVTFL
jgi:hypothetical protein